MTDCSMGSPLVPDDDELGRSADDALAGYRAALLAAVPRETWRMVVMAACEDACAGDERARDWVQRVIGIAGALRQEAVVSTMFERMSFSAFLDEVAAYRAECMGLRPSVEATPAPPRHPSSRPAAAAYWAVVFEVITTDRWRRIVEVAVVQAADGDCRARDWLTRVLGAENAAGEIRRLDDELRESWASPLLQDLPPEGPRAAQED